VRIRLFGRRRDELEPEPEPTSVGEAPSESPWDGEWAQAAAQPEHAVPVRELADVTTAMGRIKAQLDATVALVERISSLPVRDPGSELEGLFVRAQRFIDGVLADTRRQAADMEKLFIRAQQFIDKETAEALDRAGVVLADADAKADEIVAVAREQARELTTRTANYLANYLAFPPDVLEHIEESIDSFTRTNNDDVASELEALQ
jgi:hypothetical protein